jgi:protein-disulfide isomerase
MRLTGVHGKSILETMVTLTMGVAAVFLIVRMWNEAPGATAAPRPIRHDLEDISGRGLSTSIRDDVSTGSELAPVALIEYSDFECPFCARHATGTYEQIHSEFVATGRVQYVFRNYPMERIHPSALAAARAAVCANQQNRFMEMRSQLFANQRALASIDMNRTATAIGLDVAGFAACLVDHGSKVVETEKQEAARLGVSSTPNFFIGKRLEGGVIRVITKVPGAMDYSYFRRGLDAALVQETSTGS